eukprot:14876111-Alexandrium_andersonii.AAC.1
MQSQRPSLEAARTMLGLVLALLCLRLARATRLCCSAPMNTAVVHSIATLDRSRTATGRRGLATK